MTKFNFEIFCRFIECCMSGNWGNPIFSIRNDSYALHLWGVNPAFMKCFISPSLACHQNALRSPASCSTTCTSGGIIQFKDLSSIKFETSLYHRDNLRFHLSNTGKYAGVKRICHCKHRICFALKLI
jgi:hypothetical protein